MTAYLRLELARQSRELDALVWRIGLPAGLYMLFRLGSPAEGTSQGLPSDLSAMVVFAVMGAMFSGVFATAPALASERASGWLTQLRVLPIPAGSAVAAKVGAALAFALPAIALVMLVAALARGVELEAGSWVQLTLALWLATAPFAALGTLIGLLIADPVGAWSAAAASLATLWVLGGMVTEPSDLPGVLETLAEGLPSNAAAELGWAAARGESLALHPVVVLCGWSLGLGALAALAWRVSGRAR